MNTLNELTKIAECKLKIYVELCVHYRSTVKYSNFETENHNSNLLGVANCRNLASARDCKWNFTNFVSVSLLFPSEWHIRTEKRDVERPDQGCGWDAGKLQWKSGQTRKNRTNGNLNYSFLTDSSFVALNSKHRMTLDPYFARRRDLKGMTAHQPLCGDWRLSDPKG